MSKEQKSKNDLDKYYQQCPFPKPKPTKKKPLLSNGYKDKPQRRCWYTRTLGAERHEIWGGPYRQTSIEMGFQVDVCPELHAELQANGTEWAKTENLRWQMYYQHWYEQKLIDTGITPQQACETWMALIGRNYL